MKSINLVEGIIRRRALDRQVWVSVELRTKHSIVDSILPQMSECFNPLWFKTRSTS